MRYWPTSVICNSPLLSGMYAPELHQVERTAHLSHGAFMACGRVAAQTEPVETPLLIIESVGAPMRRMYATYPEFADWARLERGGFVSNDQGFFGFMIDALH